MGVKKYKPITPAQRYLTVSDFKEITKEKPEKTLVVKLQKTSGRNVYGRITSKHKGGGHKRKYRIIDFKRSLNEVKGKVVAIEYDPNRSANIALVHYENGEKGYIIATTKLRVGKEIVASAKADIKEGNTLPLKNIPFGTFIHNVELKKGKGAALARSAGAYAQVLARDGKYCHVRLPSGEVRLVNEDCKATVGQVGNMDHNSISIGKAGRKRWLGIRPRVRGVAMNPVDHPLGGGEGKSAGGRHPCSPWGQLAKGLKTRKNKSTDKYIISRRKK